MLVHVEISCFLRSMMPDICLRLVLTPCCLNVMFVKGVIIV